ncbi:Metal-dependent hydrolase, endonuclease/exonuclease/phosphatase family [Pedobacter steynii]|uniref:Metal-dependent hydrolase, endonuclease/exonuclease/phosphatase family n=1 Tax=Pedobacter steynii TaxID=430522 RepID=A0A1G9WL49_9SPHI|nr:endonuclease/exonuclease/phosphatase family protein [Pedobacter steynii]NQX40324.1 endonuclease/exonuclease/phosphatase family protein [Pedobacter steynii]SDM85067.1 Metal-dependent hydrolase, endonuclease/exonuclease/phosphatase family [Pedobacter steynii]
MKLNFQFSGAVCLLLMYAFTTVAQSEKKTLKVMTYNIHHGNPPAQNGVIDLPAIANVISSQAPDLVALQELDVRTGRANGVDQVKKLAELTGMYAFFSKGIDYDGGEYGVAILSKFKINRTERFPLPAKAGLPAEARSLAVINVTLPTGKSLDFACTHLDLKDEHRLLQVAEINKVLGSRKGQVILAGDFNLDAKNPAMAILEQHFTRSCRENCDPTIPEVNPKDEIDFILLKKGSPLKVASHQVLKNITASDHLPVVASYILP